MTVGYKDAWLESLPADMGNVNVSEGGQAASDGSDAQQEAEEQVGVYEQLLLSSLGLVLAECWQRAVHVPMGNLQTCV